MRNGSFAGRGGMCGVGIKFIMMLLAIGAIFGCAKPRPTLVVVVGGLGLSQLGDVRRAVQSQCPGADVVNAGGWDWYKADLPEIVRNKPHQHVVFIGHSFGCGAIAEASRQVKAVELAVFIDPAWSDFHLPTTIGRYLWYKRSGFGIEREAQIVGASNPQTIRGGHNDIPHSPELIAGVVSAINRIKDAPASGDAARRVAAR